MKKIIFALLLSSLLSACASHSLADKPISTADVMDNAATSVSDSLTHLAAIEQAARPNDLPFPPVTPPGMEISGTINYSGPLQPLLIQIAQKTDYGLQVMNEQPGLTPMVTVRAKNESYGAILRAASLQARNRAEVLVFPTKKLIELRYLNQ
jgi:defect-in-organelle-trafficking protein DotD